MFLKMSDYYCNRNSISKTQDINNTFFIAFGYALLFIAYNESLVKLTTKEQVQG